MEIIYLILIFLLTFMFSIYLHIINKLCKQQTSLTRLIKDNVVYIWFLDIVIIGLIWFRNDLLTLPSRTLTLQDTVLFLLLITPFIFHSGYRVNKKLKSIAAFGLFFPIAEEILFRVIILNLAIYMIGSDTIMIPFPLLKEISIQVLISAILFGIMHLQYFKYKVNFNTIKKVIFAFIFGIFMGNVVELTESILYSVIFHIIANIGAMVYYFKYANDTQNNFKIKCSL